MFNFESEYVSLKNNGAFEIKNDKEFFNIVTKLLNDKNFREDVGKKAFEVVKKQRGAIEKNIKIIKEFL